MNAIVSITHQGNKLALKLSGKLENSVCYTLPKWEQEGFFTIEGTLKSFCKKLFEKYDALIFIMASGIVVRSIAPWIKDKTTDPAVVVMDEKGKNVISLLSGHVGGANYLTMRISELLTTNPVITTSSDINQLPSVDMLAKENGLHIDSMKSAKQITAMIVNKQKVELVDACKVLDSDTLPQSDGYISGKIIISNQFKIYEKLPFTKLIPENIILGIGCKKHTGSSELMQFIKDVIYSLNLDLRSIKTIASINIKAGEPAILEAVEKLQCSSEFYTAKELQRVDHLFEGSEFVQQVVGVSSVSSTAAYLAGNEHGKFLAKKEIRNGMTISIFEQHNI